MGNKLGPRVTVFFGKKPKKDRRAGGGAGGANNPLYVYMLKKTAEFFGLKPTPRATIQVKRGNKTIRVPVRGANGASIKVKVGGTDGKPKYKSVPVPTGATREQIEAFINTFKSNKPEGYISPDGKYWPIESKK